MPELEVEIAKKVAVSDIILEASRGIQDICDKFFSAVQGYYITSINLGFTDVSWDGSKETTLTKCEVHIEAARE